MPIANGVMSITPEDVAITRHLFDAFGHYETEISAQWLVMFAQQRHQGWEPFTYAEIEKYYNDCGHRTFFFNKLISGGFIHEVPSGVVGQEGGTYHFTEQFIAQCYKSSTRP